MLSEVNSAEAAGRIAGQIFFWVIFLAGAAKCWTISRRPTTNTKCVLALMMVLLTFVIAGGIGSLAKMLGPSIGLTVVSGILGLATISLMIAAIILAILGLVEYSRHRDVYNQGRAQAIWAIVLAGLMSLLGLVGFIGAIQRANGNLSFGHSQPGKILTFDDFNFQFRSPDRPWVPFDATKINKISRVSFMRRFPDVYFILIPEKLGVRANFSSEQLAEVGKANLRAVAVSCQVLREAPLQVHGLNGFEVEMEAQVGSYQLHYRDWYCYTNGYAYQLVTYSRAEDQQRAGAEYQDLLSRFALIDPNRIATSAGGFTNNFYSTKNHYAVIVTNSAWHPFPSLDKNLPTAEFGASQGDSCFIVVPLDYHGLNLNADALASALLATLSIPYPNENLISRQPLAEGVLHGQQFDFSRDNAGTVFHYRFKILQGNDQGYLIAAWTQRRTTDAGLVLADAFARVKFLPTNTLVPKWSDSPLSYDERKAQSYLFNQAGLYYNKQGEQERALPLFCAAARTNAENTFYVGNALDTWKQLDRPKDALAFLDQLTPGQLALPDVRANQAFFQAQASFTDLAASNYANLFATTYRNDFHLSTYVNLLAEQKQYDTALSVVQSYLQAGDSVTAQLLEAEIYREKKDLPKAISLLQALHEQAPFNTAAANALVETYLVANRYSEALELSKNLVGSGGGTAYAEYLKGRSELGLKWYREAKISLTEAVKFAPANKTIRSYLDYVSGLLGEGDNTAVMDPIDPVALPAALTNDPAETMPTNYAASYGAYYLRRTVAADYQPGKESKTTESILVKILDTSGVSAFSTIQISFDPLGEQIFVNDVHVLDADGHTVSTGNLANYYVLDERSTASASQKKILNIPVSGLQPGCQLAVTFTRREQGRLEGFPFYAHSFSSVVPVRSSTFFLKGDGKGLKCQTSPELTPQKLPEGLFWHVSDPLVARWEPLQPSLTKFLPMLWISEDSAQWRTLSTNYLAAINDRLELDSALQEQVKQLTEKLKDNDSKIAALADYVQTNLTYKAIEFGRRARIPNPPVAVIRNRYGDCKDHAVLLQQMLNAAGLPAQLALVGHNGPVRKDQPSLDQFDHMIVYVPDHEPGLFLDCTSKGADVIHALPYNLAGREALILDAHDPRFVAIPQYPTNASTIAVEQHLRLVNQTDIAVDESLTLTGVHAAYLRDYLLQISESARRTTLQNMLEMGQADLTDFKIEALTATAEPLRLHFVYSLKKRFHHAGDQLRGMMGAGFARSYLTAGPADNRLSPFEITIPLSIEAKMFIEVPVGFKAEPTANADLKLNPQFASGQNSSRIDGNQLMLEFHCRQQTGEFKAADYAAYRQTMAQALSLLECEVVFDTDKSTTVN